MIPPCALVQEGRDTKPACLPFVGGPVVGRQRVAHHLASGTGVDELWVSTEATNYLHAGKRGAWSGGEGARCDGGEPGEAAESRL